MAKKFKKLIPKKLVNFYHYLWALAGALIYKFPSRNLIVIGVTGTKGKTSVSYLTYALLQSAGIKTALFSSQYFCINDELKENTVRLTTPGHGFFQKFLAEATKAGCEVAILEITSEGLVQSRHRFIDFDIVAFINIHPEHIEHHGGYLNYREAKSLLFRNLLKGKNKLFRSKLIKKTIVVNLDEKEADYFLSFPAQQKITYSIENTYSYPNHLQPQKYTLGPTGTKFYWENQIFNFKMPGRQYLSNAFASLSIIHGLDLNVKSFNQALADFNGLTGRFEVISAGGIKVIIDYAHTPGSIETLYQNIWQIFKPKRLLCLVSSAGGHRDKWKRPVIGEIACRYCNETIITDEDPVDEDPMAIMRSIETGLKRYLAEYELQKPYKIIPDRTEAIKTLVDQAQKDDVVVLIGKGAEKSIETADGPIPWDEEEAVRKALNSKQRQLRRSNRKIYSKISTKASG